MTAHITDERLTELYFTGTPSSREQQHLGACPACEGRRAALAHLLEEAALAADEDVEVVFPAERLARQQRQILQALGAISGPARVIAFPSAPAPAPPASSSHRPAMRWVAAAAAAGLVVGVVAGRAGRSIGAPAAPSNALVATASATDQNRRIRTISAPLSDDEFLSAIDTAIDGRGGASLRALDELTPHAWDVQ